MRSAKCNARGGGGGGGGGEHLEGHYCFCHSIPYKVVKYSKPSKLQVV